MAFTGALWITSKRQWEAIKEQAQIASDAITKLERPWIFVGLEKIHYFNIHGSYMVDAYFTRRNVGRSPAIIVGGITETKMMTDGESLSEVPDFSAHSPYFGPRPVAQSEGLAPWIQRFTLGEDQWVQFALGKLKLLIIGEVKYSDTINKGMAGQHVTRFCIYLAHPLRDPFPDKPVIIEDSNFWYFSGPAAYNDFT